MYRTERRKADGTLVYARDHLTIDGAESDARHQRLLLPILGGRDTVTVTPSIMSPFTRRALAAELPAKVTVR